MVVLRTLLVTILLGAIPAQAEHVVQTPTIDGSAYLLNDNEWRIGLFNLDYGATDWLEVGTVPALFPLKSYGLTTKLRMYRSGNQQLAFRIGYFEVNPRSIDDNNPDIMVYCVPSELSWSLRRESSTWSINLLMSRTGLRGEADESAGLDLSGAVLATSGILRPVYEYRTSKTGAWIFDANLSLFQRIDGELSSLIVVDERTTLELHGSGEATFTTGFMGNMSVSYHWSLSNFNLKVGIAYGTLSIPIVNFFIPQLVMPFPIIDLYWRF